MYLEFLYEMDKGEEEDEVRLLICVFTTPNYYYEYITST